MTDAAVLEPDATTVPAEPAPEGPMRLYLIDGSGYIFRAYHALPPLTRKSDGAPVGAVSGFCNMMWKLICELRGQADAPTHLAVIFDATERTFRNDISVDYKANRPPAPDDLVPQFGMVREATRAFGVPGDRARRLRGRRPDRHLRPPGDRAGRGGGDHQLRQGPDAAGERQRPDVRHHEGQEDRPRAGDREVRRRAGEGDRRPGALRRQRGQRARARPASGSRPPLC
jgi:hypothetical protein